MLGLVVSGVVKRRPVPRLAFAASAVHGQFYTGCVGNEMTS